MNVTFYDVEHPVLIRFAVDDDLEIKMCIRFHNGSPCVWVEQGTYVAAEVCQDIPEAQETLNRMLADAVRGLMHGFWADLEEVYDQEPLL